MDSIFALEQILDGIHILNKSDKSSSKIPLLSLEPSDYETIKRTPIKLNLQLNCNLRDYQIAARSPALKGQKIKTGSEKMEIKEGELTGGVQPMFI